MMSKLDLNEVKNIVDWLNLNDDVQEFSLKYGDFELLLSRRSGGSNGTQPPQALSFSSSSEQPNGSITASTEVAFEPTPAVSSSDPDNDGIIVAEGEHVVRAPMIGTFYAAPKPGAPAFVQEGDRVTPESVLCIIEVMKLMNNIEAGVHGTVKKIFVQNEQAVEYGQPIMLIQLDQ